jgi:hypothetical protein
VQLASPIWFVHVALLLFLTGSICISCESPSRPPLFGLHFPESSNMHGLAASWLLHVGLLSLQASCDPAAGRAASRQVDAFFAFYTTSLGVLWGVMMPCTPRTRWGYLVVMCGCATAEAVRHSHLLHGHLLFWMLRGPVNFLLCALVSHGVACTALRHQLEREEMMGDIRRTLDAHGPTPGLVDAETIARDWAEGPLADISAGSILSTLFIFLGYKLSWIAGIAGGTGAGPVSPNTLTPQALTCLACLAAVLTLLLLIVFRAPYGTHRRQWAVTAVHAIALCLTLIRSCIVLYGFSVCFRNLEMCRAPLCLFPAAAQMALTCTDFDIDAPLLNASRPPLVWSTEPLLDVVRGFMGGTMAWRRPMSLLMLSNALARDVLWVLPHSGTDAASAELLLRGVGMTLIGMALVSCTTASTRVGKDQP